jgi:hypothetical protein
MSMVDGVFSGYYMRDTHFDSQLSALGVVPSDVDGCRFAR